MGIFGDIWGATGGKVVDWLSSPDKPAGGVQSYDWTEAIKQRENEAQARALQSQFGEQLQQRALGKGPSVAQEMLNAERSRQMAAAQSLANSAKGGIMSQNLAQLQAMNAGQQAMATSAQQAAILRAQEQAAAEQAYAQFLAQQRAADQSMFGAETGIQMGSAGNQLAWQQAMAQQWAQENQAKKQLQGGIIGAIGGAATMAAGK